MSSQRCCRALQRLGFQIHHQRGSHITLRHPDGRRAVVPDHAQLKVGTLLNLLQEASVTREAFLAVL